VLESNAVPRPEEQAAVRKEVERIRETIKEVQEEIKTEQIASREVKSRTPSGKFLSPW
jgi:hypothetical protein